MKRFPYPRPRQAAICATVCALGASAWGQGARDGAATLDAVVVKGERVERSLRDTAASVTAFTEEDLREKADRSSVADVMGSVPNVIYAHTVGAPIIRGQDTQGPSFGASAFLGGTVPRATINLDGRYLSYNELVFGTTSIWDLDSIEIYRGPQTTTQGANSIAGAVVVRTKDPTFHREGAVQLQAGSQAMRRASAMLSAPLVDNELALRLSVDRSTRDTFIDYVNPDFAKGKSDQNFASTDARLKLLWQPRAVPGLQAKLTLAHADSNRPTSEAASSPYGDNRSRTGSMPSFNQRANTVIGDLIYDFGSGVRLSNTAQYTSLAVHRVADPANNGSADIEQNNFSNDLRLNFGDRTTAWSGVAGLFYGRTASDEALYIRGTSVFQDKKRNLGVYGELSHRFARQWLLSAGLRYQKDDIARSGTTVYSRQPLDYDQAFDAVLPKVSLAYDIDKQVTVGAMLSKGFNAGGTGLSFVQGGYYDFRQETVWNYELFTRASLLGGRLNLSGNLFYSDFKNSQRLLPDYLNGVLYGARVVNTDKARSYGLELSGDYLATDALRLRAGLGLLDTKISPSAENEAVLDGRSFGKAPRYTVSLGVDWTVQPKLKLGADLRRTARYFSTDENLPDYVIDAFTIANVRLSWQATREIEVFGYVNNLFDKHAATWKYDDRSARGIAASMTQPRLLGVGLRATF